MPDEAEQEIVMRAAAGCRDAYAVLARRYRDRLFRFLALRCGSREDAEDAVQEALVAAWRYLPSYDSRWQFSTWLFRIGLRNLPRRRLQTVALTDGDGATGDALDDVEASNVWRLARQHLSPDASSALWLHYGEGLNVRETAAALSRSVSWVKVSLMRSRRRLAAVAGGDSA